MTTEENKQAKKAKKPIYKRGLFYLVILVIVLIMGYYFFSIYNPLPSQPFIPPNNNENLGLANPAAIYCEEQGGIIENIETPTGQSGYCVTDEGTKCQQWPYLYTRGKECIAPPPPAFILEESCQEACLEEGYNLGRCMPFAKKSVAATSLGDCYDINESACENKDDCQCFCYTSTMLFPKEE